MKRFVILVLSLIMILMSFQVCFAEITPLFPDLTYPVYDAKGNIVKNKDGTIKTQLDPATKEINKAVKIKVISGYPDGTFRPKESISREEFIKMLMALATNRTFDFDSVDSEYTSWAKGYVTIAEMQCVIDKGAYTDETLKEPITRIEMILMLSKTQIKMKGIPLNQSGTLVFTDIDYLTKDEKDLVLHAAKYDLLEGMKEGKNKLLEPNKNLTRSEAAAALMRIY